MQVVSLWLVKESEGSEPASIRKKGTTSKSVKSKSTKKGKGVAIEASKTYFYIVPYRENLLPIGSIVLKSTSPFSVRTRSTRRSTATKSRPPLLRQPSNAPPSSRTLAVRERHLP